MGKNIVILLLALMISSSTTTISGFNITRLLDQHSDFSNFNGLLTQTGVADAVNSRETITVLAVDNSAIEGLNGGGKDFVRNVIATHVVLDYYDMDKFSELNKNHSALLTTLFQSTGLANGQQGFLNVTVNRGQIVFGSAVKNAQHDSQLVDIIAAQPFNISVIQVSSIIVPPGFDQSHSMSPPPPRKAPPPRKVGPPEPSPAPTPSPDSDSPAADSPTDDDSPADAPGPADDDSDSPSSAPALGPADAEAADKKEKKKSGGIRAASTSGFLVAAAVALVAAL